MTKKQRYQFISISLLVLSVLLVIPSVDWSKPAIVIGFIGVGLGVLGSILSMFVPSRYTHSFTNSDYPVDADDKRRIHIPASVHGQGELPKVSLFMDYGNGFEPVITEIHIEDGNVTIVNGNDYEENRKGKIVIS